MLIYPQLTSGALSQFPIVKKQRLRTVVNSLADGGRVTFADQAGSTVEWRLAYTGLSDTELNALQAFHTAAEGSLNGFTFVDPAANLLAWSEDWSNASWSKGPLLTVIGSVADPRGGTRAWQVGNSGAGPQSLTQTLNAPGGYLYCFSIYVRAAQAGTVTLLAGASRVSHGVAGTWSRITLAPASNGQASSVLFGIELPAGATVEVFGPQVEAQAAPSIYKPTTTGGVYENARFKDDSFRFTTIDVNRHATTVNILYANYL